MQETVVLVHGIWMTGLEMRLLRRRLRRCGYHCEQFTYQSLKRSPRETALQLNQHLQQISSPVIHLVAHSLGGIILLHLFDQFPQQKPGRVVMLGTPLQGSSVARFLFHKPLLRWLLGRSQEQGLFGDEPAWRAERDLGMIAGTRGIGIGRLLTLGRLGAPNNGTVRVSETQGQGVTRYQLVPHSHFGMLFSSDVSEKVCHFLQSGQFEKS